MWELAQEECLSKDMSSLEKIALKKLTIENLLERQLIYWKHTLDCHGHKFYDATYNMYVNLFIGVSVFNKIIKWDTYHVIASAMVGLTDESFKMKSHYIWPK